MNKIALTKIVAKTVVAVGTGKIISTIVTNNVPTDTKIDKITVAAGSYVIGAMVAEKATEYTVKTIDSIVDAVRSVQQAPTKKQ